MNFVTFAWSLLSLQKKKQDILEQKKEKRKQQWYQLNADMQGAEDIQSATFTKLPTLLKKTSYDKWQNQEDRRGRIWTPIRVV